MAAVTSSSVAMSTRRLWTSVRLRNHNAEPSSMGNTTIVASGTVRNMSGDIPGGAKDSPLAVRVIAT